MDFESLTAENSFELLLRVPEVINNNNAAADCFESSSPDFKTLETVDLNSNLLTTTDTAAPAAIDESSNEKENELDDLRGLNPCDLISDWPTELDEYFTRGEFDIEDFLKFDGQSQKSIKVKKKEFKKGRRRPGQVKITHTPEGATVFCCPECSLAYTDKLCLERHLVIHKADRRFICEVCGVAMKRKEHIQRHKLGHKDERPFQCAVCMKGFKRKEHHDIHFVIHSGEKSIFCPECGKGFYRRDHLTTHLKSHDRRKLRKQRREERLRQKRLQNKARKKATKDLIVHINPSGSGNIHQQIPFQIQIKSIETIPAESLPPQTLPSFDELKAFTSTDL